MAAKRISKSSVNWAKMLERVAPEQMPMFNAFKGKSDNYLRRALANPETPPKLDFAFYKSKIALPGLVDSFQKQYDAVSVPYPKENLTAKISEQEKQAAEATKQFIAASNERIKKSEAEIAKWDKVLPYEEMTLEDYAIAFPEKALDPINRPTLWPHTPEEQLTQEDFDRMKREIKI